MFFERKELLVSCNKMGREKSSKRKGRKAKPTVAISCPLKERKCCGSQCEFFVGHDCLCKKYVEEKSEVLKQRIVEEAIISNELLRIQIQLLQEAIAFQEFACQ